MNLLNLFLDYLLLLLLSTECYIGEKMITSINLGISTSTSSVFSSYTSIVLLKSWFSDSCNKTTSFLFNMSSFWLLKSWFSYCYNKTTCISVVYQVLLGEKDNYFDYLVYYDNLFALLEIMINLNQFYNVVRFIQYFFFDNLWVSILYILPFRFILLILAIAKF